MATKSRQEPRLNISILFINLEIYLRYGNMIRFSYFYYLTNRLQWKDGYIYECYSCKDPIVILLNYGTFVFYIDYLLKLGTLGLTKDYIY